MELIFATSRPARSPVSAMDAVRPWMALRIGFPATAKRIITITVPITLNDKWIKAARFASLLPPRLDKTADPHAPMSHPMMM